MNNFNLAFQKSKPLFKRKFLLKRAIIWLLLGISLPSYTAGNETNNPYIYNKKLTKAETCKNAKKQVNSIQNSLFSLGPKKETYLDLLKQRDQIMGKKVMIEAMLNIWDKYNSYLDANDKYNLTPASVKKSLKGLTDLKALLSNGNPQSIQKYQLMSDVFKGIDVTGIKGDDAQKNFNELKRRLKESCNEENHSQLMYCDTTQSDWDTFQAGQPPAKPGSPQAMLHKFLEVSSVAFGHEAMGWFRNLSTMFVDNNSLKYDKVGDGKLSKNIVQVLDSAIKVCRAQQLNPNPNPKTNCMTQDINNYISEDVLTEIKSKFGKTKMNAQDIVNQYLANSAHVAQANEEATGGLISKFTAIAQQNANYNASQNNDKTNNLKKDIAKAKDNFYRQSALDIAQLSRHLNILKRNDKLYKQYSNKGQGYDGSTAKKANEQLNKIFKSIDPDYEQLDIFKADDLGGLSFDKSKLFKMLKENKISKEKLNSLLQGDPESVNDKLAQIDAKLAKLKKSTEFNLLEGLKTFAWKEVAHKCASSSNPNHKMTIVDNANCAATATFSEVHKLIKFGNDYLTYQDNSSDEIHWNAINDNCQKMQKEQPKRYKDQHYSLLCHEAYDKMKAIAAHNEYYSREKVKERASVNTIWENGKKVSSYRSKSWLELMPGALTMAMPAGIQLGSTWVKTQGVKNQMFGLTTYMKNRYNYMQGQYNQGVQMCNQTLSCYYNSQYQAFLPSYTTGGVTNYGTSSFTTNSTFFHQ